MIFFCDNQTADDYIAKLAKWREIRKIIFIGVLYWRSFESPKYKKNKKMRRKSIKLRSFICVGTWDILIHLFLYVKQNCEEDADV